MFNMDKTALFYQLEPARTLVSAAEADARGSKRSKVRVTLALCANMDGSIKIKPLFIGKAKSPRPFRRIVPARYVWYGHSTNAWMTTPLFNRFLSDFDAEM